MPLSFVVKSYIFFGIVIKKNYICIGKWFGLRPSEKIRKPWEKERDERSSTRQNHCEYQDRTFCGLWVSIRAELLGLR